MILRIVLVFMFSWVLLFAKVDIRLTTQKIANAQTILVKLHADISEPMIEKSYVAFGGVRYPCYEDVFNGEDSYYGLVPAHYYSKPKKSRLVVVYIQNGEKHYRSFEIELIRGKYKSEILKVAASHAIISPHNKIRIANENKEAKKIYNKQMPDLYISKPFILPMKTKITSPFGTQRLFNGVFKSYHSGTDFRAAVGTPIKATNDGVVVLAKNRFFAGNSIILDHGQGIYTGYYHLSRFKVKVGDYVSQGEIIGLAGATGRVTGSHLHFSVKVNGVQVDPMHFIETFNMLL